MRDAHSHTHNKKQTLLTWHVVLYRFNHHAVLLLWMGHLHVGLVTAPPWLPPLPAPDLREASNTGSWNTPFRAGCPWVRHATAMRRHSTHLHAPRAADAGVRDVAVAAYLVGGVHNHHPPLALVRQQAADLTDRSGLAHARPACTEGWLVGLGRLVGGKQRRGGDAATCFAVARHVHEQAAAETGAGGEQVAGRAGAQQEHSRSTAPLTQQQDALAAACQVGHHGRAARDGAPHAARQAHHAPRAVADARDAVAVVIQKEGWREEGVFQ